MCGFLFCSFCNEGALVALSSGLREHFFSEWSCKNADGGALHGEVFHMPQAAICHVSLVSFEVSVLVFCFFEAVTAGSEAINFGAIMRMYSGWAIIY